MKSVTKAAKAKVRLLPPEGPDSQAHDLLPGMGPGPRRWQRTAVPARLGRRLRRLVYIQVPELRTWRDRGTIYPREMEWNRNAKVSHRRSVTSIFSNPKNQVRRLVGANRGHPVSDGVRVLSDPRSSRIPAIEPSDLDRRIAPRVAADIQEGRDDGTAPRTV
jgi:hypothetical protein